MFKSNLMCSSLSFNPPGCILWLFLKNRSSEILSRLISPNLRSCSIKNMLGFLFGFFCLFVLFWFSLNEIITILWFLHEDSCWDPLIYCTHLLVFRTCLMMTSFCSLSFPATKNPLQLAKMRALEGLEWWAEDPDFLGGMTVLVFILVGCCIILFGVFRTVAWLQRNT